MKPLALVLGLGLSLSALAQSPEESLRLEAFRRLSEQGLDKAAAAYVDFLGLLDKDSSEARHLRFLLLAAVAHARAQDFGTARERLREARRVLDFADPVSPLASDPRVRRQAEVSLEMANHDVQAMLAADPTREEAE